MKNFIAIAAVVISFCAAPNSLQAQKVGHLDVDSLMKIWPAYQKVIDSLADYQIQLRTTADALAQVIYKQEHMIDSMKDKDTPLVAALRKTELEQMKGNYETFITIASQEVEAFQAKLADTLYKQLDVAIARVAKENGYTYILDSSRGGQVLFANPTNDVFDLVRQELKIPVPVKKQEQAVPVIGGR